jgi:cellulose synthase/poly-beta-1,6-N-acetylglucosamine synthase-like glycosyltransferase
VKLTKNTDVSIVVPVHNEERMLDQCLISVRGQTVGEIIVVLDRCEDNSEKIAEKHAEEDPKIKIFPLREHNYKVNYLAETANFGIAKALKDIICIGEADTIFAGNYVSSLIPLLKRPVVSVSGKLIRLYKPFLQFHETIGGTGRLFLREIWEETGGFQDILACDTFFDLELLSRGYEIKVTDKAIVYDIRNYSMKQLARKAIRRGKGRRQIGQSPIFMIGHGLYCLTRTPFGIVELTANVAGYLSTNRKAPRENMRRYEIKRIKEIIRKPRPYDTR